MRTVLLLFSAFLVFSHAVGPVTCNAQDGQPKVTQGDIENLVASSKNQTQEANNGPSLGGMNFLKLLVDGGALMIPIGMMSLLVVAIGLERWVALRTSRVFPRRLRREIRRAVDQEVPMTPPELYRAAELVPSSASRVLVDMIGKVGRPLAEVENEITESIQREADRLYGNVRWLTLAAAVTPLIGLLGTVWGLILAFYNTTQITDGANRVESLAEGIYIALVTTLGGLSVAIPAAMLAHFFEGRITKALGVVDVEVRRLTRWLEQYEGKIRFDIGSKGITSRPIENHSPSHGTRANSAPNSAATQVSSAPPIASPPDTSSHATLRPPKLKA